MKVLFLQNVKGVAQIGDIRNVSDGYARNFLLPRNIARKADAGSVKQAETLKLRREAEEIKSKAQAEELAKKLQDITIELHEDANDEGHLYGSVDAKHIAKAIQASHHITLSADQFNLQHHLKSIGEHIVEIDLHKDVKVSLKIEIKPLKK